MTREITTALRRAADAAETVGGKVTLLPGLADEVMDGWEVPVPEETRALLRVVGGLWVDGWAGDEGFGPGNSANDNVGSSNYYRAGEPGTFRVLHLNAAAETYYVDVDPATGAWGRVFGFHENADAFLVAPSLPGWLLMLAEHVTTAAGLVEEGECDDLDDAFGDVFFGEYDGAPAAGDATVTTVAEARESGDPVLAEAAARVPEESLLADLRGAAYPTDIPFGGHATLPIGKGDPRYRRLHNGDVLAAVPVHVD